MEWLSLFLVVASGTVLSSPTTCACDLQAERDLRDRRHSHAKPGWINRYLPPLAKAVVPDIAVIVGFLWSALMFASAGERVCRFQLQRRHMGLVHAALWILSRIALFLVSFAMMRFIGRRRYAAMPESEREALATSAA